MNSNPEQPISDAPAATPLWPLLRLAGVMLALAAVAAAALVWGQGWALPQGHDTGAANFRYVNSAWISPLHDQDARVFNGELRTFVITNQTELDDFEAGFSARRTYGNTTTLGRIDFDRAVLLAAYYIWRPVRGDPLSVVSVRPKGGTAVVDLELAYEPQGREYPYLYAPMVMAAVERSLFPEGEPVDFLFRLNGKPDSTKTATPNPG